MSHSLDRPLAEGESRATSASSALAWGIGVVRSRLWAGAALAAGVAWLLSGGVVASSTASARLLRGMALVKGVVALVALALVHWRLRSPISDSLRRRYLVGAWLIAAAPVIVWRLHFVVAGAILFDLAAVALILVAWRDDDFLAPAARTR